MKAARLVVVGAILLLAALGCVACGGAGRATERSTQGVVVNGTPQVYIENFNGRVDVTEGEAGRVAVDVVKHVPDGRPDQLANVEVTISQDAQAVRVRSRWTGEPGATNVGADLAVRLPQVAGLVVLCGNGDITYRGPVEGDGLAFTTGTGSVTVTLPADARFSIKASAGSGQIASDFEIRTSRRLGNAAIAGVVGDNPATAVLITVERGDIQLRRASQ